MYNFFETISNYWNGSIIYIKFSLQLVKSYTLRAKLISIYLSCLINYL